MNQTSPIAHAVELSRCSGHVVRNDGECRNVSQHSTHQTRAKLLIIAIQWRTETRQGKYIFNNVNCSYRKNGKNERRRLRIKPG